MLIWLIFIFISLSFLYSSTSKDLSKSLNTLGKYGLMIVLIGFAGLRDGLGQDYAGYYRISNAYAVAYNLKEPIYSMFRNLVYHTNFTINFFFLMMALITNVLFISTFYKYKNIFLIVYIYLFLTIFYFNTFNLVRQMCAVSIFVYSTRFIEGRNILKYIITIIIASGIHISAIFLLPVYFFAHKKFNNSIIMTIYLISIFVGQILKIDFSTYISFISAISYWWFFIEPPTGGSSGYLTLLFNIVFILIIVFKNKILIDQKYVVAFNLFFLGVVLYNLIPSFYYLFRFALYFIIFSTIILPQIRNIIRPKYCVDVIILSLFGYIFLSFLLNNIDNKLIVPEKILPVTSIYEY